MSLTINGKAISQAHRGGVEIGEMYLGKDKVFGKDSGEKIEGELYSTGVSYQVGSSNTLWSVSNDKAHTYRYDISNFSTVKITEHGLGENYSLETLWITSYSSSLTTGDRSSGTYISCDVNSGLSEDEVYTHTIENNTASYLFVSTTTDYIPVVTVIE